MTKTLFVSADKIELGDSKLGDFTPLTESPEEARKVYDTYIRLVTPDNPAPGRTVSIRDDGMFQLSEGGKILETGEFTKESVDKFFLTIEQLEAQDVGDVQSYHFEVTYHSYTLFKNGEEFYELDTTVESRKSTISVALVAALMHGVKIPWVNDLEIENAKLTITYGTSRLEDVSTGQSVEIKELLDPQDFNDAVASVLVTRYSDDV